MKFSKKLVLAAILATSGGNGLLAAVKSVPEVKSAPEGALVELKAVDSDLYLCKKVILARLLKMYKSELASDKSTGTVELIISNALSNAALRLVSTKFEGLAVEVKAACMMRALEETLFVEFKKVINPDNFGFVQTQITDTIAEKLTNLAPSLKNEIAKWAMDNAANFGPEVKQTPAETAKADVVTAPVAKDTKPVGAKSTAEVNKPAETKPATVTAGNESTVNPVAGAAGAVAGGVTLSPKTKPGIFSRVIAVVLGSKQAPVADVTQSAEAAIVETPKVESASAKIEQINAWNLWGLLDEQVKVKTAVAEESATVALKNLWFEPAKSLVANTKINSVEDIKTELRKVLHNALNAKILNTKSVTDKDITDIKDASKPNNGNSEIKATIEKFIEELEYLKNLKNITIKLPEKVSDSDKVDLVEIYSKGIYDLESIKNEEKTEIYAQLLSIKLGNWLK